MFFFLFFVFIFYIKNVLLGGLAHSKTPTFNFQEICSVEVSFYLLCYWIQLL